MEWGPDFCLVCDKQTTGGAYCSQACRLTDETSGLLPQSSSRTTSSHSPSSSTSSTASTHGLHLPPALNFSALRRPSYDATPSYQSRPSSTTTATTTSSTRSGTARPQLSPSSSRSSLTSISSSSTAASNKSYGLTESAMHQLQDYVSAFDQTRDMKRRFTVQ